MCQRSVVSLSLLLIYCSVNVFALCTVEKSKLLDSFGDEVGLLMIGGTVVLSANAQITSVKHGTEKLDVSANNTNKHIFHLRNIKSLEIMVMCENDGDYQNLSLPYLPISEVIESSTAIGDECKGWIKEADETQECVPYQCTGLKNPMGKFMCPLSFHFPEGSEIPYSECHAMRMGMSVGYLVNKSSLCSKGSTLFPLRLHSLIPLDKRNVKLHQDYEVHDVFVGQTFLIGDEQFVSDYIQSPKCPLENTKIICSLSIQQKQFDLCLMDFLVLNFSLVKNLSNFSKEKEKLSCTIWKHGQPQAYLYVYLVVSNFSRIPISCPQPKEKLKGKYSHNQIHHQNETQSEPKEMLPICHWHFISPFVNYHENTTTESHIITGKLPHETHGILGQHAYVCIKRIVIANPWISRITVHIFAQQHYCHQEEAPKFTEVSGIIHNERPYVVHVLKTGGPRAYIIVFMSVIICAICMSLLLKFGVRLCFVREEDESDLLSDLGNLDRDNVTRIFLSTMGHVSEQENTTMIVETMETKMANSRKVETFCKKLYDLEMGEDPSIDLTPSSTVSESFNVHKREQRMLLFSRVRVHVKDNVNVMTNKTGVQTEPQTEPQIETTDENTLPFLLVSTSFRFS